MAHCHPISSHVKAKLKFKRQPAMLTTSTITARLQAHELNVLSQCHPGAARFPESFVVLLFFTGTDWFAVSASDPVQVQMGLGGFTVQSLPLHGQIVLVAQAAQFASVAPLDPRSKVLKHLTMLALVVGAATVVDIVVAGIVSDIVEET